MPVRHTKESLEEAASKSTTWASLCRLLGVRPFTGAQSHIRRRCAFFGVSTAHFLGQAWSRGKKFVKSKDILYRYLVKDGPRIHSHRLKVLLIRYGLKPNKCEKCGVSDWYGNELPLELDHINNDHYDNRLENLLVVCPNCHAVKTRLGTWARVRIEQPTGLEPVPL